ncbi:MAG: AIPR family protein [Acidobacteriia bacterium]|nr:AIPR family protein [Terriglobia bacterium]
MEVILTIQRLTHALDKQFENLIDLSDLVFAQPEEKRKKFLTRAQAAYCLTVLTDVDPEHAARAVTDGFQDQGIDAVHFSADEKTLYIVQSKWSSHGNRTIDEGECQKFLHGIQQLIKADFSGFNDKIKKREAELRANLLMRSDVRVVLALAYSSPDQISESVQKLFDNFLEQQNNVGDTEVFSVEKLNLVRLYSYLSGSTTGNKIKLQVSLRQWGKIDSPYRAYYGQVSLSDIANWAVHGKPLLSRNLRFYRGSTDVNDAIGGTITNEPHHFWYFNNGITILCSKVDKTLLNGDARDVGIFDCEGVSVVNGAQTVGVIWEAAVRRNGLGLQKLPASVHVRLISLESCPEGFAVDVTRATNTQNEIQHRDFAALDTEQQRLATEMELDGKKYAFKSGDADPQKENGCNIEDATIALACAKGDVTLAVQAKREVGQLWRDIKKAPYTTLFNNHLSARHMWLAVQISRAVSDELDKMNKDPYPRGWYVAVHGNRFILHLVFQDPEVKKFRDQKVSEAQSMDLGRAATRRILPALAQALQERYPSDYLANLFKNAQKCKILEQDLSSSEEAKTAAGTAQPNLFSQPNPGS